MNLAYCIYDVQDDLVEIWAFFLWDNGKVKLKASHKCSDAILG